MSCGRRRTGSHQLRSLWAGLPSPEEEEEVEERVLPVSNSCLIQKRKNHITAPVALSPFSFFSPHLIVTVDIVTAVFDQLSSLVLGKGMNSSGPFAKFGQELLGLIRETPESCSCCVAALLPASAEGPRCD